MKAKMKSKSRRQWILGGVVILGGLSLLTVGFATWVIGTTIKTDYEKTTVSVQTAQRESILLEAELSDSTIAISEAGVDPSDSNHIYTKSSDGGAVVATDFQISFSKLQVTVSQDYITTNNISSLSLEVSYLWSTDGKDDPTTPTATETAEEGTKYATESNNTYTVPDSDPFVLSNSNKGRSLTNKKGTFVDLASDTIALNQSNTASDGNYTFYPGDAAPSSSSVYTYTLLKWGTLFGGNSPCTFFNGVTGVNWDTDLVPSAEAEKELDAMYNGWNGKTLCIQLEIDETKSS